MRESLRLAATFCDNYFSENIQTLSLSSFSVSDYLLFAILGLSITKKLTPKIQVDHAAIRTILSRDETFVAKFPARIARTSDSLQVRRLEKKH